MSIFNPEGRGAGRSFRPVPRSRYGTRWRGWRTASSRRPTRHSTNGTGKPATTPPGTGTRTCGRRSGCRACRRFQELARKLGAGRMQEWIDTIGYGDRDTSAGVDLFWLPAPGHKSILISPHRAGGAAVQAHIRRASRVGEIHGGAERHHEGARNRPRRPLWKNRVRHRGRQQDRVVRRVCGNQGGRPTPSPARQKAARPTARGCAPWWRQS